MREGGLLPTLIVDGRDGTPHVVPEVIAFMQAMTTRGESLDKLRGIATVLALLHDYMVATRSWEPIPPHDLPDVIGGFLRLRRMGGSLQDEAPPWPPVKRQTVDRDRHYLRLFSEFCAERYGHFPVVPLGQCSFGKDGEGYRGLMRRLSRERGMLLAHIAGSRSSMVPLVGLPERTVRRRPSGRATMPKSMIEDLIQATPSLTQRMAFVQAAFGGQRISEILNQWRCDVLPGRLRPVLFPDDVATDVPLVVLAHPSQSRYVGESRPGTTDRLQYLSRTYGLKPRNLIEGEPMEAGWKGMLMDNEDLLASQVFWVDRAWARIFHEMFQQLRDRVLPGVADAVRRGHPYLIVNDAPGRDEFGQPMKMSNIRKAFDRALARLGVDAERYPRGVHGLRHAYKAMLEGLGMSPEEVRKAMHHVSVGSQRAYGETTARLNERMTLLLGGGA
jgi:hypothetical protein